MTEKIAFVYDCIYPYSKGGAERRYYEIANRLTLKGYEVHLYGMKLWQGPNIIKKEGIYLHGICPPKPLYTKNGRRSIKQAIFFGIHCLKLIKEDFDIIDCCGFPYFSLFAVKIACRLKSKKLYSTWHEVWGEEYWKEYLGRLWIFGYLVEKITVQLPDQIIAASEITAKSIMTELAYTGPMMVIPNGIDLNKIRKVKPATIRSDIIYVGRLMDFKHVDLIIKSVSILKKDKRNIKCIIIGDGPEKKKLEELTQKLNLGENIKFLGFLEKHEDVYSLLKSSKIFILSSTREGFGIIVIEANACGVPVITISHRDNAAKDLIEVGKNGFVCRLDEKEMAKRIADILDKGLNENLKQYCVDLARKYDWDKIVKEIEEVYLK